MAQHITKSGLNLTTVPQTLYTCPASTSSILKLFFSNTNDTLDCQMTVKVRKNNVDYTIANSAIIYAGQTQMVDTPVHLVAGDSIIAYADANGNGTLFASIMEYSGSSTSNISNAGLISIPNVLTTLYTCPANESAIVRLFLTNLYSGDILYKVQVTDASTGSVYPIANNLDLYEQTTEFVDVGITLTSGDTIQVKSNISNTMSVFASIAYLP